MSTSVRRKNPTVIERLQQKPGEYTFTQAMRLIERAAIFAEQDKSNKTLTNPVGGFTPPNSECIRFEAHQTLSFPSTTIGRIEFVADESRIALEKAKMRWQVVINFLGLTGATGVLPFHYTELIFSRLKLKDESLSHFLDLFNHRTASLFYQASRKYRLPLVYEKHQLRQNKREKYDRHTHTLLSLMGLSTPHLINGLNIPYESLIHFAGFFCQQIRSASALKQMISSYFGVPVYIKEMRGEWQELIDDVRTRLPHPANRKGQNVCLGRSAMTGKKGWFAQGKGTIIIGPLNDEQFQRFAPNTNALKQLNDIVKLYAGSETEFEYRVRVDRSSLPSRIQLKQKRPPTLGWNTWLAAQEDMIASEEGDTLDIKVTPS